MMTPEHDPTQAEVEQLRNLPTMHGTPEALDFFSQRGFLEWFGPTSPIRR
jgi:hypothetical protein